MRRRSFVSSLNKYIIKSDCVGGSVSVQEIGGGYRQVGIIPSSNEFVFYDKRDSVTVKIDYETNKTEEVVYTREDEECVYISLPSGLDIRISRVCVLGNEAQIYCSLAATGSVEKEISRTPVTITQTYGFRAPYYSKVISPDMDNVMNMKRVFKNEEEMYGDPVYMTEHVNPSKCVFHCTYNFSYDNEIRRASFSGRSQSSISYKTYNVPFTSGDSSSRAGTVDVYIDDGRCYSNTLTVSVNAAFAIQC